jgi:hypothetical protein
MIQAYAAHKQGRLKLIEYDPGALGADQVEIASSPVAVLFRPVDDQ